MELNPSIALQWLDWQLMLRLGVAAALGLVLGLDRELRGHAAGMRTHGLICFTSAAATVSIIALYLQLGPERMDPLRLFEAAGSFIGIVGAGLIVFARGQLHNITTAANLWLAAIVRVACGAAQWPLVLVATIISIVMLSLLRILERHMGPDRRLSLDDGTAPRERR